MKFSPIGVFPVSFLCLLKTLLKGRTWYFPVGMKGVSLLRIAPVSFEDYDTNIFMHCRILGSPDPPRSPFDGM
jgi:hypothetical protein